MTQFATPDLDELIAATEASLAGDGALSIGGKSVSSEEKSFPQARIPANSGQIQQIPPEEAPGLDALISATEQSLGEKAAPQPTEEQAIAPTPGAVPPGLADRLLAAQAELGARADERFEKADLPGATSGPTPKLAVPGQVVGTFGVTVKPKTGFTRLDVLNEHREQQGLPPASQVPERRGAGEVLGDKTLTERVPFAGAGLEAADLWQVHGAAVRAEEGTATPEDWQRLTEFQERLVEQSRGTTFGGTVAQIAAESIPFMAEFLASGGVASLVKGGTKKVARKVIGRKVYTEIRKAAQKDAE